MEFLASAPLVGPTLSVALPFLLVLSIVVFVHEFGHYIVGRWCGIGAEAFSIGFGRELIGWTDRRGTRWKVSALPLGGYVKFLGDADASSSHVDREALARMSRSERAHAFPLASVERRALTVAAGPVFNFLLSIVIFAGVALWQGAAVDEPVLGGFGPDANPEIVEALRPGDRVLALDGVAPASFGDLTSRLVDAAGAPVAARVLREGAEIELDLYFLPPARVDAVAPGGPAEQAGLAAGDRILAIDGVPVAGFADLQAATAAAGDRALSLTVRRGDTEFVATLAPRMTAQVDPATGERVEKPLLGIQKQATELLPVVEGVGPLAALGHGLARTWTVIDMSLSGLARVATGVEDAGEVLGGPIRIAQISGDAAAGGLGVFIGLIAVLSTSIGLINLFPIPVLDGGHLLFYAIEKARGRPLRERWQEIGNGIGFALVLSLMAFATLNDLARL
jgi:regulator of sigma E protease